MVYWILFQFKSKRPSEDKPRKEVANLSVTCQLNQINKAPDSDYKDKNISVLLQASVSIRYELKDKTF